MRGMSLSKEDLAVVRSRPRRRTASPSTCRMVKSTSGLIEKDRNSQQRRQQSSSAPARGSVRSVARRAAPVRWDAGTSGASPLPATPPTLDLLFSEDARTRSVGQAQPCWRSSSSADPLGQPDLGADEVGRRPATPASISMGRRIDAVCLDRDGPVTCPQCREPLAADLQRRRLRFQPWHGHTGPAAARQGSGSRSAHRAPLLVRATYEVAGNKRI